MVLNTVNVGFRTIEVINVGVIIHADRVLSLSLASVRCHKPVCACVHVRYLGLY